MQAKSGKGWSAEKVLLRRRPGEAATRQIAADCETEASATTRRRRRKGASSQSWQCGAVNEPEEQRRRPEPGGRVVPRSGNEGDAGESQTGKD